MIKEIVPKTFCEAFRMEQASVLKVASLFPILGKVLPRDLSPLKPVLVEGVWDRVRSKLAPLEVGGTSR
jgi:hypothetical protein